MNNKVSISPPSCSCLKWTILTAIPIYDFQRGNQHTVAPLNLPYQALCTSCNRWNRMSRLILMHRAWYVKLSGATVLHDRAKMSQNRAYKGLSFVTEKGYLETLEELFLDMTINGFYSIRHVRSLHSLESFVWRWQIKVSVPLDCFMY